MKNIKIRTNHDHFEKEVNLKSLFAKWVTPKIGYLEKGSLRIFESPTKLIGITSKDET